jgi:hypothetical protein
VCHDRRIAGLFLVFGLVVQLAFLVVFSNAGFRKRMFHRLLVKLMGAHTGELA